MNIPLVVYLKNKIKIMKPIRITFPNDYYSTEMKPEDLSNFKLDKTLDDVVFGWWDDIYISIDKKDYETFMVR